MINRKATFIVVLSDTLEFGSSSCEFKPKPELKPPSKEANQNSERICNIEYRNIFTLLPIR
ncbi:hypothetical protein CEE45_05860 [Candidatus Heimdallarchaeota archaeon B3_Heim]|nr:MAG: hypothetical protein CEE45_05860 [Candidatus Heimdallarchaeota archaeon B3_Heim]